MGVYEATQKQRYIERGIRNWKRQEGALEAAGLDHEFETGKVREWQGRMREFTRQTGLTRQRDRERIFGAGAPPKAVAVPPKPVVPLPAIPPALQPISPQATVHDAADQIIALHEKNDGSTFSLIHGNMAGRPYYSVSIFPDLSVKILGKSIDPDILEKFIRDHEDLARNIKEGIGTW